MVIGRPTVMTEAIVSKLEEGFAFGLTDRECCLYAGICHQALYDYCNKHPEFTDRKEMLKDQPLLRAKLNITKNINNGDLTDSKWYLERKGKKEFSLRTETDSNIDMKVQITMEEDIKELAE